jgi:hypothetical protein
MFAYSGVACRRIFCGIMHMHLYTDEAMVGKDEVDIQRHGNSGDGGQGVRHRIKDC